MRVGDTQVEEVVCQLTYQDMSQFNAIVSGWSSRLLLADSDGETAAASPARRSASAPGLSPGLSTPTAVTPAVSPRGGTAAGNLRADPRLPSPRSPAGMAAAHAAGQAAAALEATKAAADAASLKGIVALSDSEYGEEEEEEEEEAEEVQVWERRDPRFFSLVARGLPPLRPACSPSFLFFLPIHVLRTFPVCMDVPRVLLYGRREKNRRRRGAERIARESRAQMIAGGTFAFAVLRHVARSFILCLCFPAPPIFSCYVCSCEECRKLGYPAPSRVVTHVLRVGPLPSLLCCSRWELRRGVVFRRLPLLSVQVASLFSYFRRHRLLALFFRTFYVRWAASTKLSSRPRSWGSSSLDR